MHTWLPIHVEIPAEHFVIIVNYICQAYEQMNKVGIGSL